MKLWTGWVVVALIAGLALAGCGKKEDGGNTSTTRKDDAGSVKGNKKGTLGSVGSVSVTQSSAKATLETIARAFKAHDGEVIAACLPPEYKDSMGPMMVGMMDVMAKADSLKRTVEAKFGKEVAEKALASSPAGGKSDGPLEGGLNADGSIDWKKVKVTENGDTATVEIEGKPSTETLKKINGKWCMEMKGLTPEKAKAQGAQGAKMAKAMSKGLEEVDKQVKDGKVTKDDLEKVMGEVMMKAMAEAMKDTAPN